MNTCRHRSKNKLGNCETIDWNQIHAIKYHYNAWFSLEMQRDLIETKYTTRASCSAWKETHTHTHTHTSQKPSKIAAAENLFPSLYAIGTAMNVFITYDIYKTLFNTEIYRYLEVFWEPPCFCVFWGKCFERNSDFMFSISTITLQCC